MGRKVNGTKIDQEIIDMQPRVLTLDVSSYKIPLLNDSLTA